LPDHVRLAQPCLPDAVGRSARLTASNRVTEPGTRTTLRDLEANRWSRVVERWDGAEAVSR
jgi:hypothetical protein